MKKPCDNCPWRRDAPVGYWDPEHFRDIWRNCQDDGMSLMLCHKSRLDEDIKVPCAGAILVLGFASIGIRIATMRGTIDPAEYGADGLELYSTFAEMLEANGITVPARNKLRDA